MNRWTIEEINILREQYEIGQSPQLIAKLIHRTEVACKQKAHRLGFAFKHKIWSDEDLDKLRELYRLGKDGKDIARILDRTLKAVHSKASLLDLKIDYTK